MAQKKKWLGAFGALRALSCIAVIGVHCYIWDIGYVGLAIFFMLSGFLLVYNYYDRTDLDDVSLGLCLKFSWKRIKKLIPLHIITLLFFVAENMYALITGLAQPSLQFFIPTIANLFLIQSWIPVEQIYFSMNSPTWYLSVCVFLYAMFPVILRRVKRFGSITPAILWSLFFLAVQIFFTRLGYNNAHALDALLGQSDGATQWVLQVCPPLRLCSFIIGCNMGFIFMKTQDRKFSAGFALGFELLTAVVMFFTFNGELLPEWFPRYPGYFGYSLRFMLPAVMFIFAFAYGDGPIVKLLTNRFLLWLGDLSGYMYILHWMVLSIVSIFVTRLPLSYGPQRILYLVGVFGGTTFLAWLYKHFEDKRKKLKAGKA